MARRKPSATRPWRRKHTFRVNRTGCGPDAHVFLFYLQCFVLILNGDSDALGILVRRRCSRARSGGELFPKKEVTGDRFPSRKRVLFKSRVGESVERGDCLGGRGRFGDIFFLLFLSISPSLSIAVQESKEECKGQLGLNTLFSFLSLSLSLS